MAQNVKEKLVFVARKNIPVGLSDIPVDGLTLKLLRFIERWQHFFEKHVLLHSKNDVWGQRWGNPLHVKIVKVPRK